MQHIPKELNEIVDYLTKLAFNTSQNLKVFDEISREVLAITSIVKASVSLDQEASM